MVLRDSIFWGDQLIEVQKELDFYNKVRLDYENLQSKLRHNEHLRVIYEPSAKELLQYAEEDLALAFSQIAHSVAEDVDSVSTVARQTNASVMDITLKTSDDISGFVDMGLLGNTLNRFQSLVYAIIDPSKGRKKKQVKVAGALSVSAFAPGSFVIRVHENTNGLIADENQILETTIPIIGNLMEASEDAPKLKETTSKLDLIIISAYRRLLNTLASGKCGVNLEWVAPSGVKRCHSMDFMQIKKAISVFNSDRSLSTRQYEIDGILKMFERDDDIGRHRFKLTSFDDVNYNGVVDRQVTGHFVPKEVTALLEEQVEINNTTDEAYTTYTLLSVEDYVENDNDK